MLDGFFFFNQILDSACVRSDLLELLLAAKMEENYFSSRVYGTSYRLALHGFFAANNSL